MNFRIELCILLFIFLFSVVQGRSENRNIPCFVYHRIGDSRYPSTNCPVDDFEQHLHHLKQNGYQTINASEINDDNKGKTVIITFDDGYRSILSHAIPLLKKYNYTATIYINTQMVGGNEYLSWKEIIKLKNEGFEFGSHSHSHAQFVSINNDKQLSKEFTLDLKNSQDLFLKYLQNIPKSYAYPYGESNAIMKRILKKHNYHIAFVQQSGIFYDKMDYLSIPRFSMTGILTSTKRFAQALTMKPLHLKNPRGNTIITSNNKLRKVEFNILTKNINPKSFQLFINGNKSEQFQLITEENKVILSSTQLITRRTKFTFTAQSITNPSQWHWYTLLVIKQDLQE